jgi:hypothetical protein
MMPYALVKDAIKSKIVKNVRNSLFDIDFDLNQIETNEEQVDTDSTTTSRLGTRTTSKGLIHYALDTGNKEIFELLLRHKNLNINLMYTYNYRGMYSEVGYTGGGSFSKEENETEKLTPVEYAFNKVNKPELAMILIRKGGQFDVKTIGIKNLRYILTQLSDSEMEPMQEVITREIKKAFEPKGFGANARSYAALFPAAQSGGSSTSTTTQHIAKVARFGE